MKYPLHELVVIKQKKLDEAERILREKKELLAKEEKKLLEVEKERNTVKEHKNDKLQQLRDTLDAGSTSDKIQQMKSYLKVVEEQLRQKELKVKEQQKVVDAALKAVELARSDMLKKQQDVEKLKTHRTEWEKEMRAAEEYKETMETEEMGSALYKTKKKFLKHRGKHDS